MATIKDVARLAGVGVGTASRAISGRGAVSADALARVRHAVAELDFRPSQVARALSTRTSGMIGIYVPNFAGDFYGPILQAIDAELRGKGLHMVAANGVGAGDGRRQAIDGAMFLIDRDCDGVLLMSNELREPDYEALWARCDKLVVVNRASRRRPDHAFCTDHLLAGRLAARALLGRGHREIACIGGPGQAPDAVARMSGFHAELDARGHTVPARWRIDGDFTFAGGDRAAAELLARGGPVPTALFCANDVSAMAAISRCSAAGLEVPARLSVLGYDDSAIAPYTTPALTTVRIPIVAAALNGLRFLLNRCYGLDLPVERDFPPEVVWRASLGPGPHPPLEELRA